MHQFDVIVIGGGATGAGVARDAAMRGFKTLLIERGEIGSGTSGKYHGVLHSGGRYAVDDPESAKECIQENIILKKIARSAIDDTGGLFIILDKLRFATFVREIVESYRLKGMQAPSCTD